MPQRHGQRDVVCAARAVAFGACGEHPALVQPSPLQAVQNRFDGLEKHRIAGSLVSRGPRLDVESPVPCVRRLGAGAGRVDQGMAGKIARLVVADLVLPKPQREAAAGLGRQFPTAAPQHPGPIEFMDVARRLLDPRLGTEIPPGMFAPNQQTGRRTLAMLEEEPQRGIGFGRVPRLARGRRQCVKDLVQVLAVLRIAAGQHPVVWPDSPCCIRDGRSRLQSLPLQHPHRPPVQRLGEQRRMHRPDHVAAMLDHRIRIRADPLQEVGAPDGRNRDR
jgi:hypothetical protein